jgi:hypothetical protein
MRRLFCRGWSKGFEGRGRGRWYVSVWSVVKQSVCWTVGLLYTHMFISGFWLRELLHTFWF